MRESLEKEVLKTIESMIRKSGGYDPTLWSASFRREEFSTFQESEPEPRAQHTFFHGRVFEKPLMADRIEAFLDVSVEDPLRRVLPGEKNTDLRMSIPASAIWSEAVGYRVRVTLNNGVKSHVPECLIGTIFHGRDSQRSLRTVFLGNIDPSQREYLRSPEELEAGLILKLWRCPKLSIDTRRSFASVFLGNLSNSLQTS
jgi:hypothetical protein